MQFVSLLGTHPTFLRVRRPLRVAIRESFFAYVIRSIRTVLSRNVSFSPNCQFEAGPIWQKRTYENRTDKKLRRSHDSFPTNFQPLIRRISHDQRIRKWL